MDLLKQIFADIDFHLNARDRILTIKYGESLITIRLTEEGKVKLDMSLALEAPVKSHTGQMPR